MVNQQQWPCELPAQVYAEQPLGLSTVDATTKLMFFKIVQDEYHMNI